MKTTVGFLERIGYQDTALANQQSTMWTLLPERMSVATRIMLLITLVMLVLLIGNYVFAEWLYAYSFYPAWSSGRSIFGEAMPQSRLHFLKIELAPFLSCSLLPAS